MAYASTPNKHAIRTQWDRVILESGVTRIGRRLTYLGLPGPEIRDFVDWADLLDSKRTGVESVGRTRRQRAEADETIARLQLNVMARGISSGFQLLRGDIEEIILETTDRDGNQPQLITAGPAHHAQFSYDLVNLDFEGGFGYANQSGPARRVQAIRRLFERQRGRDFILLLTINVRDTIGEELDRYLHGLHDRAGTDLEREAIDWYLARGVGEREYRLKAVVSSLVAEAAETNMFQVTCRPAVAYRGHAKSHMLHLVFELTSTQGNLRAFSSQAPRDLLALPLIRVVDGALTCPSLQVPGLSRKAVEESLRFLGEPTAVTIEVP